MKKKLLFSRIAALICCIAMCATFIIPLATTAADGDSVQVTFSGLNSFKEVINVTTDSAVTEDTVTVTLQKGNNFQDALWIQSDVMPKISGADSGYKFTYQVVADGLNAWLIQVKARSTADNAYGLSLSLPAKQYNVTFISDSSDYDFIYNSEYVTGQTVAVDEGTLSFSVSGNVAGKTVTVKANGKVLSGNGTYSAEISSNTQIRLTVADQKITVTEPNSEEGKYTYTAASSTDVVYGGSFSFYVTPEPGYDNIVVKVNNKEVKSVGNNLYVINNIVDATTITVDPGKITKYAVILPSDKAAYDIAFVGDATSFDYNSTASFTVTEKAGYEIVSVTATVDGKTSAVTLAEGKYSVVVKGETIVNVTTRKIAYSVNYEYTDSEAFSVTKGAATAEYGTLYTFYVTPAAGYKAPEVKVNTVNVEPVSGNQYAITVTSETKIVITAGAKIEYDVTLPTGTGYTVTGKAKAYPNESYTFNVTATKGYHITRVIVNGVGQAIVSNGQYIVYNVTNAPAIVVEAEENVLTINYVGDDEHQISKTVSYNYNAISENALVSMDSGCKVHKITGWTLNGNDATVEALKNLIATGNNIVTLVANIVVDEVGVKEIISLMPENLIAASGDKTAFSVRALVTIADDPCISDISIEAYGAVISLGGATSVNDPEVINAINNNVSVSGGYSLINFGSLSLEAANNDYIYARITSTEDNLNKIKASGNWLKLDVNGETIVIISENGGYSNGNN